MSERTAVSIRPMSVANSIKTINEMIEEAKKLQRDADALVPQLLRMVRGRLHVVNAKGMHSHPYHELLMDLKKELSNYNGLTARWEK